MFEKFARSVQNVMITSEEKNVNLFRMQSAVFEHLLLRKGWVVF